MGYAIYYDERRKRDLGYAVPAICDHPSCNVEIDRGVSYVCGGEPYSNEHGCALYFCEQHRHWKEHEETGEGAEVCERCKKGLPEFPMKPDMPAWIRWKLSHESWKQWRDENPDEVQKLRCELPPEDAEFNKLAGKYRHYCYEFDMLAIDETLPEFAFCRCFPDEEARRLSAIQEEKVGLNTGGDIPDQSNA